MRRWLQRTHLAPVVALAVAACARGEHAPVRGGIAVTDDAGRRVTLAAPARRIVSLLPSFTEILFAIGAGDRLVGRTTWCDYPPGVLAVPSVGDAMPPSVEAVAARRPDLVVLYRAGTNLTPPNSSSGSASGRCCSTSTCSSSWVRRPGASGCSPATPAPLIHWRTSWTASPPSLQDV